MFSATTLISRSGLSGHYVLPAASSSFVNEYEEKDDDEEEA